MSMDNLRVRAYNVQFGDAILVTFPEITEDGNEKIRHILFDVGNVLSSTKGGSNEAFQPVFENILDELGGNQLDLYIMTHEHLDHVQGPIFAEKELYPAENEFKDKLHPKYAWLTKSAHPYYYDDYPDAKKKSLLFRGIYDQITKYITALAASGSEMDPIVEALWINNNHNITRDCVDYIASLADNTYYIHRGFDTTTKHPFNEAKIEIWAPEENTAEYYGRFRPMLMNLGITEPTSNEDALRLTELYPPPGVYAGAFYNLVNARKGYIENLLQIDKAANNTSVVCCIEWRGVRLLFTGDAEEKSWKIMNRENMLKPVDFLKVSHHASENGMPSLEILEKIVPDSGKIQCALVSTWLNTYSGVPDEETIQSLHEHCVQMHITYRESEPGEYIDIYFDPKEPSPSYHV